MRRRLSGFAGVNEYTARSYVQDGLICFYDETDPDGEITDTSYVLKQEGNDAYENPYTVEFVFKKETSDEWEAINWNTAPYSFLLRKEGTIYGPNAYLSGSSASGKYPTYRLVVGDLHSLVVTADGEGTRQWFLDGKFLGSFAQEVGGKSTTIQSASPKKMKLSRRTAYPHSYRLYSRLLTDDEIFKNHWIDRHRFPIPN